MMMLMSMHTRTDKRAQPLPALATAHTARRFPVIDIDDDLDQLLASVDIPESSQTFSINSSQSVTESKNAVWEEKGRVKLLRERLHTSVYIFL